MIRLVSLLLALVASIACHAQDAERPNFLLITSEDMSPDLGCYGVPNAITPNLDELARQGNRYSAAFSNGPICSPARTAFIFGRYQTSLGAGNHRSRANTAEDLLGFATVLRDAGYYCTNGPKVDYNTPRIWDVERATYDRGKDWSDERRNGRPFLSIINLAVSHQSFTSVLPHESYVRQVRRNLRPEEIHDPADVVVPPYFPDTPPVRAELARYADCVTLMDKRAGAILDRLEADGLADNTIVMYFSDHGSGHPRHKSTPFASGLRVPFIVYCPPKYEHLLRAPAGEVCDDVVSFVDVGPTLIHLAGLEVPGALHGTPFLGDDVSPSELSFNALDRRAESFNTARSISDGRYIYLRSYMPHLPIGQPKGYGFPSSIYQELYRADDAGTLPPASMSYMRPPPAEMLFDLVNDPYETVNLAADPSQAGRMAGFRDALRRHRERHPDLNMVPEEELASRAGDRPWTDLVDELPMQDIYGMAELVGRGAGVLEDQLAALDHAESVVRWWAVVGLRSQEQSTRITQALESLLQDESELVRVEAADALLAAASPEERRSMSMPRRVLLKAIAGDDPRSVHRAGRAAQVLRLNDDQFARATDAAAKRHRTEWTNEVAEAIKRQRAGLE